MRSQPQEAGPSHAGPGFEPIANGGEKPGTAQVVESQHSVGECSEPEEENTPSRGRDKGKRKVTFDVAADVVAADVVAIPSRRDVDLGEATAAEELILY